MRPTVAIITSSRAFGLEQRTTSGRTDLSAARSDLSPDHGRRPAHPDGPPHDGLHAQFLGRRRDRTVAEHEQPRVDVAMLHRGEHLAHQHLGAARSRSRWRCPAGRCVARSWIPRWSRRPARRRCGRRCNWLGDLRCGAADARACDQRVADAAAVVHVEEPVGAPLRSGSWVVCSAQRDPTDRYERVCGDREVVGTPGRAAHSHVRHASSSEGVAQRGRVRGDRLQRPEVLPPLAIPASCRTAPVGRGDHDTTAGRHESAQLS